MDIRPIAEVKPPAEPVMNAASLAGPGRALDIACGCGRHSIWLYQHGWKVTAIDRDAKAVAQIRRDYPGIDARLADLEDSRFEIERGAYDLVVCWLYHQRDLYPRIREGVRPGGCAALSALLEGRFAAGPGELQGYFAGWTILHQAEVIHRPGKRAIELLVRNGV